MVFLTFLFWNNFTISEKLPNIHKEFLHLLPICNHLPHLPPCSPAPPGFSLNPWKLVCIHHALLLPHVLVCIPLRREFSYIIRVNNFRKYNTDTILFMQVNFPILSIIPVMPFDKVFFFFFPLVHNHILLLVLELLQSPLIFNNSSAFSCLVWCWHFREFRPRYFTEFPSVWVCLLFPHN